ncbi:MAG: hypothetical protein P4L83_19740 [Nevskia sp.]|nr:hypothetical protein [Nevskia sp.]
MRTLIHNTVKTDRGDYTFNTREEAEAFFIAVALRERERNSVTGTEPPPGKKASRAAAKAPRRPH